MKKRNIDYHVMMLPGMIILIAFYFVPMLGCCMAFQDFIPAKGILGSKWIGFENFKYMFFPVSAFFPDIGDAPALRHEEIFSCKNTRV